MIKWLYILMSMVLLSCNEEVQESSKLPATLPLDQYVKYIGDTDNGFMTSTVLDNIRFSAMFLPTEYLIAQQQGEKLTPEGLKNKSEELKAEQTFRFQVKSEKPGVDLLKLKWNGSEQDYFAKSSYLSFDMAQDFKLIQGKDTLLCNACQFAKQYNVAPTLDFVLTFPSSQEAADKELIYRDQLFGLGTIRFRIKQTDINELPKLEI